MPSSSSSTSSAGSREQGCVGNAGRSGVRGGWSISVSVGVQLLRCIKPLPAQLIQFPDPVISFVSVFM